MGFHFLYRMQLDPDLTGTTHVILDEVRTMRHSSDGEQPTPCCLSLLAP